jgi:Protein of unknown function (DUF3489)
MSRIKARKGGFEIEQTIDPLTGEVFEPGEKPTKVKKERKPKVVEIKSKRERKSGTTPNRPPKAISAKRQAELDKIQAEYDAAVAAGRKTKDKPARAKKAATKKAAKAKDARKSANGKAGAEVRKATREPKTDGPGAKIIELIKRPEGAGITELMSATGWQAHSVRGFLSTATQKKGMPIIREQVTANGDGVGRTSTIYKWAGQ